MHTRSHPFAVVPVDISIADSNSEPVPLFVAGSQFPQTTVRSLSIPAGEDRLKLKVLAGRGGQTPMEALLATLGLDRAPGSVGQESFELEFTLDANGIINVSGAPSSVRVTLTRLHPGLSALGLEEMSGSLETINAIVEEPPGPILERDVARLVVELEGLEAEVALLHEQSASFNTLWRSMAKERFERLAELRKSSSAKEEEVVPRSPKTEAEPEVQREYRALVWALHPDLGRDEGERRRRTQAFTAFQMSFDAGRFDDMRRVAATWSAGIAGRLTEYAVGYALDLIRRIGEARVKVKEFRDPERTFGEWLASGLSQDEFIRAKVRRCDELIADLERTKGEGSEAPFE